MFQHTLKFKGMSRHLQAQSFPIPVRVSQAKAAIALAIKGYEVPANQRARLMARQQD
jgi:hypothetical protein